MRSRYVRSSFFRFPLVALIAAGFGLGVAACGDDDDDGGPTEPDEPQESIFEAQLSGDAEVPPVDTDASGTATFTLTDETVEYEIEVSNLVDVVAAHIHVGTAAENGPIAVGLFASEEPQTIQSGVLAQGQFTASDVQGDFTLGQVLNLMESGGAYVNVHTTANPPGEIRGQLELVQGPGSSSTEEGEGGEGPGY